MAVAAGKERSRPKALFQDGLGCVSAFFASRRRRRPAGSGEIDPEPSIPWTNRRSAPRCEADPQFGWSSLLARREAGYQTSVVSWESEFPLLSFQLSLSLSPGMAPRTLNIR